MSTEFVEGTGYILGRQSQDVHGSIEVSYWVKTANGVVKLIPERQQTAFFVSEEGIPLLSSFPELDVKEDAFFSLDEIPAAMVSCTSLALQEQALTLLKKERIPCFEDDVRAQDRYLMERKVYGGLRFIGVPNSRGDVFTQVRMKPEKVSPSWKVWSLDIETSVSRDQLLSIGIVTDSFRTVFVVTDQQIERKDVVTFADEKSLLLAFLRFVRKHEPDIFIGWSVINFDLSYIDRRCEILGVRPAFGVDGQSWSLNRRAAEGRTFIRIPGRVALDGIDLLKVGGYHFESYSLDNVSREILQDSKLLHGSQRWQEIERLHREELSLFVDYNLQDCDLVWRIFDKLQLIRLQQTRVDLTGIPLDQMGGSVAAFENLYLPVLHQQKWVAPARPVGEFIASPGGFVMDSLPGLYKNVLVMDFKSLYPSIIRTFLVDPLARVIPSDQPRVTGFRGASFARERAILPDMISQLASARELAKQQQDDILSYAIKIIMNSFYGVLGSNVCRFYHPQLASSITMRGHQILAQTKSWVEEEGGHVIYGDTDSLFVVLPDVAEEKVRQQGETLCRKMNLAWQQWCQEEMALESHLELEFERIYQRFFMPTIRGSQEGSKKRYAGLTEGELVFKGLEAARSDWTPLARQFQKQLFERIFQDLDPTEFVLETVARLQQGELDRDLVYQKQLTRPLQEYRKQLPPHVRAAQMADQIRRQEGLQPLYNQGRKRVAYLYGRGGVKPYFSEQDLNDIDYDHYIQKQLEPIADSVLPLFGTSMEKLMSRQMGLL